MKFILILFCVILLVAPISVQANGGIISVEIPNPLNYKTIEEIICALTDLLKTIGLGIGIIMVIWGGIQIMTGTTTGEKESKVVRGKKTITWAVIGYAIIISVDFIIEFVVEILGGGTVPPACQ